MGEAGKSKKLPIIIALIAVVLLGGGAGGLLYYQNVEAMRKTVESDKIYDGISISGVSVGGMTKEEAEKTVLLALQDTLDEKEIIVHAGDNSFPLSYRSFSAKYNVSAAVEEAYQLYRSGTVKERYKQIKAMEKNGVDISLPYTFDENAVKNAVLEIEKQVAVEPKDSTITRENGTFTITEEESGIDLAVSETTTKLLAMVQAQQSGDMEAEFIEIPPKVTKAENEKATTLIGSFYTNFSSGAVGRNENLRVGCANINGTVLLPGEVFSMNEGLGPQTYANGYRNAAVIVNGKLEDGLGGGVCQITTTLYNAVIFAELEVVERKNHSLPVAYVPLGRDAAIAGDYTDFKFKNNTEYPVYIEAYLDGNKLITNLYGNEIHSSSRKVEFEKVMIGTIAKPAEIVTEDPNRPEGEREITYTGKVGYKVETYKNTYENNTLLSREYFSTSTYRATPDEVTVGTKKAEIVPAAATGEGEQAPATQPQTPPAEPPESGQPAEPPEEEQPSDADVIGAA